jgi:copper chaperone CopZ
MRAPAALVLPVLFAVLACDARREPEPPPVPLVERMPPVDPERTIEVRLEVRGMTCSGCEYNVASALRLVAGVLEAEADHASGRARVRFDPGMTSVPLLVGAVQAAGYEAAGNAGEGE